MLVQLNCPEIYEDLPPDWQVIHLGDPATPDYILLTLPKNWGAASISKIRALRTDVSSIAESAPCILAGCEMTCPDHDIHKYIHKERDAEILALTQEAPKRSTKIGCRNAITLSYLRDIIKIPDQSLALSKCTNNTDAISIEHFLILNGFHGAPRQPVKSIERFQLNPMTWHEKSDRSEKDVLIRKPFLSAAPNRDSTRINAYIRIDEIEQILYFETDSQYGAYLDTERSNPFIAALLPLAMRARKNIVCEAPASASMLYKLNSILVPHLAKHDPRLYKSKIRAEPTSINVYPEPSAIATGISCGVDSIYIVKQSLSGDLASPRLTHLYAGNYLYGNNSKVYDRANDFASHISLPLIATRTNITDLSKVSHLSSHFYETIAVIPALRKLIATYCYSATDGFGIFNLSKNGIRDTIYSELLLLYVFSPDGLNLLPRGNSASRPQKTRSIADKDSTKNFLNVCLHPELDTNYGSLEKCLRILLTLDMCGAIDEYDSVFNTQAYKDNRENAFKYLIEHKNSGYPREAYEYFSMAEPI